MSTFTTSDGVRLDYHDDGPPDSDLVLVLVHGWSQSRAMFDRAIPALSEHARVVSYDQRGHGESDKPDHGARIPRLAADLHELVTGLGIQELVLVGHSLGSSIAWSYVDTFGQDSLRALVLVDQPSACTVLPWMTSEEGAQSGAILDFAGAEGFCKALLGPDALAARTAFLASMLSKDLPAADFEWLLAENLKAQPEFLSRLLLDHVMQDWRDVIPRITVPTLVVGGEVSHVNPDSQAFIADQVPGARLRVFAADEGGSHFPFFEDPAPFVAELVGFLGVGSPVDHAEGQTPVPA